jgi:hypothetical protein
VVCQQAVRLELTELRLLKLRLVNYLIQTDFVNNVSKHTNAAVVTTTLYLICMILFFRGTGACRIFAYAMLTAHVIVDLVCGPHYDLFSPLFPFSRQQSAHYL